MDHDPANGAPQRAWLTEAGYVIAFRSVGWIECLIRRDNERWFGTGGDEAEAFANALHAALPSEAARRAFAIATRLWAAEVAEPVEPVPQPPDPESVVDPVTNTDLVEDARPMQPSAVAIDLPEPVPQCEAPPQVTVPAASEAPVDSLPIPPDVRPAAAEPVAIVAVPQSEPAVVERLSLAAAHAELDDL